MPEVDEELIGRILGHFDMYTDAGEPDTIGYHSLQLEHDIAILEIAIGIHECFTYGGPCSCESDYVKRMKHLPHVIRSKGRKRAKKRRAKI